MVLIKAYLFFTLGFNIVLSSEIISGVNQVGIEYSAREIFLNRTGRFGSSNGKFPAMITYKRTPALHRTI